MGCHQLYGGLAYVVAAQSKAKRLLVLDESSGYTSGYGYKGVVPELHILPFVKELLDCSGVVGIFGVSAVIFKGVALLLDGDVVLTYRYADLKLSVGIGGDGLSVLGAYLSVYKEMDTLDGVFGI